MGACLLLNQTPLRAGGFSERALSPARWYGGFLNHLQGTMKEQTETEMAGESNLRLSY